MQRTRRALFCLFFVVAVEVCAQVPQISLGTPLSDGSIPIQISSSGNPPAAIQFDVTYDNTTVASLAATIGSSATSASKTLYTEALQPNTTRMILVDMNQNNIPDGALVSLVVTPLQSGGTGPYTINFSNVVAVTANGSNMAISSPGGGGNPGGGGSPPPFTIANGASNATGAVAPGEFVTVWIPAGMVPAGAEGQDLSLTFNGASAPITYPAPSQAFTNQINIVTPFELAGQSSAQVALDYQGMTVAQGTVSVASTAPGVFVVNGPGAGQAVLVNQDGRFNSATNPAAQGSIVALFATGAGVMKNPALTDGEVIPLTTTPPTSQPAAQVALSLCGVDINPNTPGIQYSGPVPGTIAGVLQVNFVVPSCKNTGSSIPLYLFVGGVRSQTGLTIAIQ